jgi:VWFA-related protein
MRCRMPFLLLVLAVCVVRCGVMAQGQQQGAGQTPTIQVTSRLVYLDVTVLDKKGKPVVTWLTRDDFTITEDKKPQTIFSFEAPQVHFGGLSAANAEGQPPVTIIVLDLLNSSFPDFAYIRYEVKRFLDAQPSVLSSRAELMVVGNQSLEMVQPLTRSRADLLNALHHIPPALPYKEMSGSFWAERFNQSIDALQEIALQTRGVPGRKNIVWVGHGSPGFNMTGWPWDIQKRVEQYLHATTNMLVDSRVSLYVIYPGLSAGAPAMNLAAMDSSVDLGDGDPFMDEMNFGLVANETGGKLFFNRNDVDSEMRESERLGSEYYTLTYQPHNNDDDGRFERIRVTLRNPNLRTVTKAGYFASDKNAPANERQQWLQNLVTALQSEVPFDALTMQVEGIVQHSDTNTVQFTVRLTQEHLMWTPTETGSSQTQLVMAAASLDGFRDIVTSKIQGYTVTADTQDAGLLQNGPDLTLALTIHVPKKAKDVRLVVEPESGQRMGSVEIGRKAILGAPSAPTPKPQVVRRGSSAKPSTLN